MDITKTNSRCYQYSAHLHISEIIFYSYFYYGYEIWP